MTEHQEHGHPAASPHTHEHGRDQGPERPPFLEETGRKGGHHERGEVIEVEKTGLRGHHVRGEHHE